MSLPTKGRKLLVALPVLISLLIWCLWPQQAAKPPKTFDAAKVYREDVIPLLDRYEQRNREAIARAVANMHERLKGRRSGIDPFISDISRWGTRFGIVGRTGSDLWQKYWNKKGNAQAVGDYVNGKFRHYVLSESALQQDIAAVLEQFHADTEASRNQFYVELRLPLGKLKSPAIRSEADYTAFKAAVQRQALEEGKNAAIDSVTHGLTEFMVGQAAMDVSGMVTARLVEALLARASVQVAISAAEMGGTTAGAAATGAGSGSFGGPAGTIIGFAVGIAVGTVVDWWMTSRFEAELRGRLNRYFDAVDHDLIKGSDKAPGMEKSLQDAVRLGMELQRNAVVRILEVQQ